MKKTFLEVPPILPFANSPHISLPGVVTQVSASAGHLARGGYHQYGLIHPLGVIGSHRSSVVTAVLQEQNEDSVFKKEKGFFPNDLGVKNLPYNAGGRRFNFGQK